MTPKEKAIELFGKFMNPIDWLHKYPMCQDTAKQCALIAIDEILSTLGNEVIFVFTDFHWVLYWEQVKKEIEAL